MQLAGAQPGSSAAVVPQTRAGEDVTASGLYSAATASQAAAQSAAARSAAVEQVPDAQSGTGEATANPPSYGSPAAAPLAAALAAAPARSAGAPGSAVQQPQSAEAAARGTSFARVADPALLRQPARASQYGPGAIDGGLSAEPSAAASQGSAALGSQMQTPAESQAGTGQAAGRGAGGGAVQGVQSLQGSGAAYSEQGAGAAPAPYGAAAGPAAVRRASLPVRPLLGHIACDASAGAMTDPCRPPWLPVSLHGLRMPNVVARDCFKSVHWWWTSA